MQLSRYLLRARQTPDLWWFLAVALLWLSFLLRLRFEWSFNEQYSFGWFVPLLGSFLLFQRWLDRPVANPPSSHILPIFLATAALLILLLPIRILEEANPDWRKLLWIHVSIVLALSVLLLWLRGGYAWVNWFFWSLLFFCVAIPWPTPIETGVVQTLSRFVAATTAEISSLMGYPALAQGNLIQVPIGLIGVSEACSGVRSIQASLMCCAFFALYFRLNWIRSIGLLLLGILTAVLMNVVRTLFLTLMASSRGIETMESFHDAAGHVVVVVIFGFTWFLGARLAVAREPVAAESPSATPGQSPALLLASIAMLVWLGTVEILNEAWFRSAENGSALNSPTWTIVPPSTAATQPLPTRARQILRCDSAKSWQFNQPDGTSWTAFMLDWHSGSTAAMMSRSHSPEVCLPAFGMRLVEKYSPIQFQLPGTSEILRFDRYRFEFHGKVQFVFFAVWDPATPKSAPIPKEPDAYQSGNRLQAALNRQRLTPQRVVEIVISGVGNVEDATRSLKENLNRLLEE